MPALLLAVSLLLITAGPALAQPSLQGLWETMNTVAPDYFSPSYFNIHQMTTA